METHFEVDDESIPAMVIYDLEVALVFQIPSNDAREVSVSYIGFLKDILKVDYGSLQAPVVLLHFEWVKRQDNRGNAMNTRDDAGFLVVNFKHKLPHMSEPFIFSSQVTQVFFSDIVKRPGWKVMLRKEARLRREVVQNPDAFIKTTVECSGLTAPTTMPAMLDNVFLIGVIKIGRITPRNLYSHTQND